MRACTIVEGRLEIAERPAPEAGPGEVVVRVHGAGLNRADLLQRAGGYPAPPGVPADVPGLEFAGVVGDVGAGVHTLADGRPGVRYYEWRRASGVPRGARGAVRARPRRLRHGDDGRRARSVRHCARCDGTHARVAATGRVDADPRGRVGRRYRARCNSQRCSVPVCSAPRARPANSSVAAPSGSTPRSTRRTRPKAGSTSTRSRGRSSKRPAVAPT